MLKKIIFLIVTIFSINAYAQIDKIDGHNSRAPIDITSDSLEIFRLQNKAIFLGDVIAKQGNIDIRAEKMTVFYTTKGKNADKKNEPDGKISRIEMDNKVFISTPNESAQGNKGIYDVDSNTFTINGDVTLTKEKNIVKGQKFIYNTQTGQSKIIGGEVENTQGGTGKKGRVHGVFIPGSN